MGSMALGRLKSFIGENEMKGIKLYVLCPSGPPK